MIQALNFRNKAIEGLLALDCAKAPMMAIGIRYLIDKLKAAQVFVLPDHGELLERSKPRPEVPGTMFRPPFPIVALEYTAASPRRWDPTYSPQNNTCSRRISLAWDWQDDLPAALRHPVYDDLGAGVVVQSIAFYDQVQMWIPIMGAIHIPYDGEWRDLEVGASRFTDAMREQGNLPKGGKGFSISVIPMLIEPCRDTMLRIGQAEAIDIIRADTTDEVAAFFDLTTALACKNVRVQRQDAPEKLNRARVKVGKLPLPDHHILILGDDGPGGGEAFGSGASRRSHLRRGHIRRLGEGRITWVNQTMVHGRGGFAAKTYKMGAAR